MVDGRKRLGVERRETMPGMAVVEWALGSKDTSRSCVSGDSAGEIESFRDLGHIRADHSPPDRPGSSPILARMLVHSRNTRPL